MTLVIGEALQLRKYRNRFLDCAQRERGFTLLELLIVLSIMVVLAGVAVPNMKQMIERIQFRAAAEDLHATLGRLHDEAMWERKIMHLSIDADTRTYRSYEHDREEEAVARTVPVDVQIESDSADIRFYPDGAIDIAHILLTDKANRSAMLMTQGVFGGIKMQLQ